MGKLGKGLLGRTSGKVGPVVGAKWKDLAIVRAIPRRANVPATVQQVQQRSRLSLLSTFFSMLMGLLEVSFRPLKKNQSAHNAAVSFNLCRAVFVETGTMQLDYPQIVVSRGSLFSASGLQAKITDEGMLKLSWKDDSGEWCDSVAAARESDQLTIVLNYRDKHDNEMMVYFENIATRAELSVKCRVAKSVLQAPLVHCWIYFAAADGKMVSPSQYFAIA